MTKFVIEKGVPVAAHGNAIYPFGEMEVGDSFILPNGAGNASSFRRSAALWAARNNAKVTIRKVDGGLRVWRLS
jgi:hypothetical protein